MLAPDAFERLRERHASEGLAIDASTAFPHWDGERVAYDMIVQGLVKHANAS